METPIHLSMNIHGIKSISFERGRADLSSSTKSVYIHLRPEHSDTFTICCFEDGAPIELPDKNLCEALQGTLGLIRKAQERLCAHLAPDSSGDDRECLSDLLAMFAGPEQREIEKKATAALMPF